MKITLRLLTLGASLAFAIACGGQSGDARTGDSTASEHRLKGFDEPVALYAA